MTDTTGERWFKIITAVGSGFVAGISIANAIYYNNIRTGSCNAVSQGEATTMLWINIVIAVLAIIIFFWALYLIFFSSEVRTDLNTQSVQYINGQTNGLISGSNPNPVINPIASNYPYNQTNIATGSGSLLSTANNYPYQTNIATGSGNLTTTSSSAAANVVPYNAFTQNG